MGIDFPKDLFKDRIFSFTRRMEGGYVNDPVDRGGPTHSGITQQAWNGYCIQTGRRLSGVRGLTEEDVRGFYDWWWGLRHIGMVHLPDPGLQLMVYDMSFLFWEDQNRWLQEGLVNQGIVVVVDGVIGPRTGLGCLRCDRVKLMEYLYDRCKDRHFRVTGSRRKFLRGWLRRNDLRVDEALQLSMEWRDM